MNSEEHVEAKLKAREHLRSHETFLDVMRLHHL